MSIHYVDVGNDLRRIEILGRLDTTGTNSIASQLVELASAPKKAVVIDLTGVKFLASIGVGAIVSSAKAVEARGGKLALVVDEGTTVRVTLKVTGVDTLVPVFKRIEEAEKAALA